VGVAGMEKELRHGDHPRESHRQLRLSGSLAPQPRQAMLQVEGKGERGMLLRDTTIRERLPLVLELGGESLEVAAAQQRLVPVQGEARHRIAFVAAADE